MLQFVENGALVPKKKKIIDFFSFQSAINVWFHCMALQ